VSTVFVGRRVCRTTVVHAVQLPQCIHALFVRLGLLLLPFRFLPREEVRRKSSEDKHQTTRLLEKTITFNSIGVLFRVDGALLLVLVRILLVLDEVDD
jgi:hypothetical protein